MQFFLEVITSRKWSQVLIITAAHHDFELNPTFSVLEVMADSGILGPTVKIMKVCGLPRYSDAAVGV